MSNFIDLQNFSIDGINPPPSPILNENNQENELFGEFKSALPQPSQESDDFVNINTKIDNILYQISLLRDDLDDIKTKLYNPAWPGKRLPNLFTQNRCMVNPLQMSYSPPQIHPVTYEDHNHYIYKKNEYDNKNKYTK
jgi:hypothetical protein